MNLKGKGQISFLFVHYMDPHAPCQPSYHKEIEKIDQETGKIIGRLNFSCLLTDNFGPTGGTDSIFEQLILLFLV